MDQSNDFNQIFHKSKIQKIFNIINYLSIINLFLIFLYSFITTDKITFFAICVACLFSFFLFIPQLVSFFLGNSTIYNLASFIVQTIIIVLSIIANYFFIELFSKENIFVYSNFLILVTLFVLDVIKIIYKIKYLLSLKNNRK